MLAWALAMWTLTEGELRWQAPVEQCPSAERVRAQIDAAGGLGALQVDAVVSPDASGGWVLGLTIVLDDVSDTRSLRDADCAALAEAAVLLIATRLDPERVPEPEPRVESPPRVETPASGLPPTLLSPEPTPVQPPPQVFSQAEPPARALPTGLTFAASAGLSLGSVPTPGVPSELALGYAWPRVRASVRGRVHVASPRGLDDEGNDIRVVLGTAGPRVCARPAWKQVEFPLCGELGLGGSRAVTRGPLAQDRAGLWLEAGVGAGIAWFVAPRWALTAHLAGASPLVGTRYTFEGDERWDPAPVAGRALLGVEFFAPIQIRSRPEKSQ